MDSLTTGDIVILAVAAYVATMALVRLMCSRRDALVVELRREAEREKGRKEAERHRAGRRRSA